jgi:hypothetical protein
MSTIENFISKYSGKLYEGEFKSAHSPFGRYDYQQRKGIVNFKGQEIYLGINEVGGANPIGEPFRMKLIRENPLRIRFLIQPRGYWARTFRALWASSSKVFKINYRYKGDSEILRLIMSSKFILDSVEGEFLWIQVSSKHPNVVMITPERGYRDVNHLEKMANILIEINSLVY